MNNGGYQSHPLTAELYDHVVPYRDRTDIDFYVELARKSGGPVLELGCGTGRVLLPIARAGIDIVGLDLSPYMLDVCRKKREREPVDVQNRIRLVQGDMRSFDLERAFTLITTPFRGFQHLLEVEDQLACLHSVRQHLAPRGWFILDLFNPSLPRLAETEPGEEFGEEPPFQMSDGREVVRTHRITDQDYHRQIIHPELIYTITHPDGKQEKHIHAFAMRYFFRYEAGHLLARCGFKVEALYADYDRSPYGSTYPGELIFVASSRQQEGQTTRP